MIVNHYDCNVFPLHEREPLFCDLQMVPDEHMVICMQFENFSLRKDVIFVCEEEKARK